MLYYINCLFLYSLLGFVLESTVFKIKKVNIHSGIFYGPITEVYGFGAIALILLKIYIIDKLKCNKYLKVFITYILCVVVLTLIEFLGGNILNILFDIDMWNYTKKTFNCGKYICLELSLVWGFLGCFIIYYGIDFFNKIISIIPQKLTYLLIIINIIDTIAVLITK